MGEFIITLPGGAKYKVEANSYDEAFKEAKDTAQQEVNTKQQAVRDAEPMWAKPFRTGEDVGKTFLDAATLSTLPAAADWAGEKLGVPPPGGATAAQDVTAARERLGLGAIPADIAGGLVGPGKFNLATQGLKLGGGKIARGAIGLLAGGVQGAAEGAISAASRGESIPGGAGVGALAGGAGTGISHAMSGVGNRAAKWWSGIDDTLPPASPRARAITPSGQVERAVAGVEATPGGGTQRQLQSAIADIAGNKAFTKKPEVQAKMQEVIHGDPATKGAKWLGNAANVASLPSSITLGMGGNVIPALISAVGLPAIGGIANAASKGGTQASTEELRRMLLNHPKYKGILSPEGTNRVGSAARRAIMNQLEEEQGY